MGRIRTIKPELFTHEGLFDLEQKTGLPIRICWCGLFTVADKEGRFIWRPRTLKTSVCPYDNLDLAKVLDALFDAGFVDRYQVDGETYGCIPTWRKHQLLNNRERESTIPPDPFPRERDASSTREPRDEHAPSVERKGLGEEDAWKGPGKGPVTGTEPPLSLRPAQKAEQCAGDVLKLIGIRGKGDFLQKTLADVSLMHFEENPEFDVQGISKWFCEAWFQYNYAHAIRWLFGKRISPETFFADGHYREYDSWNWKDLYGPQSGAWNEEKAAMELHVRQLCAQRDERERSRSGK